MTCEFCLSANWSSQPLLASSTELNPYFINNFGVNIGANFSILTSKENYFQIQFWLGIICHSFSLRSKNQGTFVELNLLPSFAGAGYTFSNYLLWAIWWKVLNQVIINIRKQKIQAICQVIRGEKPKLFIHQVWAENAFRIPPDTFYYMVLFWNICMKTFSEGDKKVRERKTFWM